MIGLAFANNPHMAVEVFHCLQDHLRDFDLFKGCQELHREFMMLLTMFDQVSGVAVSSITIASALDQRTVCVLGKALPSRLQALKALRFPGMRNSIAKNSHKRTFKKSTTFAVAMQNLGLRSGSRNRKTQKNHTRPQTRS